MQEWWVNMFRNGGSTCSGIYTVDYTIKTALGSLDLAKLESRLREEGVQLTVRQNKEGRIYGITYIDHKSKCVFNGSDLGKPYAAAGLLQRLDNTISINEQQKTTQQQKISIAENENQAAQKQAQKVPSTDKETVQMETPFSAVRTLQKALDILTQEEYAGSLSIELQNVTRKRKRKRLHPE